MQQQGTSDGGITPRFTHGAQTHQRVSHTTSMHVYTHPCKSDKSNKTIDNVVMR